MHVIQQRRAFNGMGWYIIWQQMFKHRSFHPFASQTRNKCEIYILSVFGPCITWGPDDGGPYVMSEIWWGRIKSLHLRFPSDQHFVMHCIESSIVSFAVIVSSKTCTRPQLSFDSIFVESPLYGWSVGSYKLFINLMRCSITCRITKLIYRILLCHEGSHANTQMTSHSSKLHTSMSINLSWVLSEGILLGFQR